MDYKLNKSGRKEMQRRAGELKKFNTSTVQELYDNLGKLIAMGHGNAFVAVSDDNGNDVYVTKKEYTQEDIYNAVGTDYKVVWLRCPPEDDDD